MCLVALLSSSLGLARPCSTWERARGGDVNGIVPWFVTWGTCTEGNSGWSKLPVAFAHIPAAHPSWQGLVHCCGTVVQLQLPMGQAGTRGPVVDTTS